MKIKNTITTLLIVVILASCAPMAKVVSTETDIPTSTFTPVPPTATVKPTKTLTPTPTPESIASAKDLPAWLGEFVDAYGGAVTVGGLEMGASQLLDEIVSHGDLYIHEKIINGKPYSFLVVNDIPLAIRYPNNKWQEVTLSVMGKLTNIETGTVIVADTPSIPETWWAVDNTIGTAVLDYRTMMPSKETINFDYPNYQARIIREWNNMPCRIQAALFWGSRPAWLGDDFTQDDLDYLVRLFMENAKKNKFSEVVVVNETGNTVDRDDPYYEKFGDEYVLRAFRMAREIYPEAKLIYNDSNNHLKNSGETIYTKKISEHLLSEGLIDYVGVEMHVGVNTGTEPNKQDLIEIFKSYPVPVLITEFDVTMKNVPEKNRDAILNEIVETVYSACLESGVCKGITLWNYADWEVQGAYSLRGMNNEKKQAYFVATRVMYQHLP